MSSWNNKSEDVIKQLGENVKSYKIMHLQQAQKACSFYKKLTIAGIVIGPMAGILSAINQIIYPDTNPTIPIIEILLGFLSGIIVAIIKFGKHDEAMNSNQSVAARYTSLESNIRRQMCLYRNNRISAEHYLEWVETKYNEIISSAPLITQTTYNNFVAKSDKNGYTIPNMYESIITINTENVPEIVINMDNEGQSESELEGQGESELEGQGESELEGQGESHQKVTIHKVKRTTTMAKIPEINQYSDKMLQYEMKRMFHIN